MLIIPDTIFIYIYAAALNIASVSFANFNLLSLEHSLFGSACTNINIYFHFIEVRIFGLPSDYCM